MSVLFKIPILRIVPSPQLSVAQLAGAAFRTTNNIDGPKLDGFTHKAVIGQVYRGTVNA